MQLEGSETPFLGAVAASARALSGTMGFEPLSWRALADGSPSRFWRTRGLCTDPVASRPRSRIGSDSCSHVPSHEDPATLVQGDPVAASVCLCPCLFTCARVAVQSIRLATTGLHCMCEGRSAWAQGVLLWKVWWRAFAERQEDASLPM